MPFELSNQIDEIEVATADQMIADGTLTLISADADIEMETYSEDSQQLHNLLTEDKRLWNHFYQLHLFGVLEKAMPDWLGGEVSTKSDKLLALIKHNTHLANYCYEKEYYLLLHRADSNWHKQFFEENSDEFWELLSTKKNLRHYYYSINRFEILEKLDPKWYEEFFTNSPEFIERLIADKKVWNYCRQHDRYDLLDLATPTWNADNFPVSAYTIINIATFCYLTFGIAMFIHTICEDQNERGTMPFFPAAAGIFLAATFYLTGHVAHYFATPDEPSTTPNENSSDFITLQIEPVSPDTTNAITNENHKKNSTVSFADCIVQFFTCPKTQSAAKTDALSTEELQPLTACDIK